MIKMAFDPDFDLTESFNEVVTGNKKKKSVTDFEFSRENAATLDLGFDEAVGKNPIEQGQKNLFEGKKSNRKNKRR